MLTNAAARRAVRGATNARKALYDSDAYLPTAMGMRDLLCDLLHLMEAEGMDVGTEVRAAVHEYDRERTPEDAPLNNREA